MDDSVNALRHDVEMTLRELEARLAREITALDARVRELERERNRRESLAKW